MYKFENDGHVKTNVKHGYICDADINKCDMYNETHLRRANDNKNTYSVIFNLIFIPKVQINFCSPTVGQKAYQRKTGCFFFSWASPENVS